MGAAKTGTKKKKEAVSYSGFFSMFVNNPLGCLILFFIFAVGISSGITSYSIAGGERMYTLLPVSPPAQHLMELLPLILFELIVILTVFLLGIWVPGIFFGITALLVRCFILGFYISLQIANLFAVLDYIRLILLCVIELIILVVYVKYCCSALESWKALCASYVSKVKQQIFDWNYFKSNIVSLALLIGCVLIKLVIIVLCSN